MKALTDKIIEALEKMAHEQFNEFARGQLLSAVEEIKQIERDADFEEAARVLMKHLGLHPELYCPHHSVIIDNSHAELVQGVRSTGIVMDYIPD